MGCESLVRGRLVIDPPLPWEAFKDSEFHPGRSVNPDTWRVISYVVREEPVTVPDGVLHRRTAVAVQLTTADWVKCYELEDEFNRLVEQVWAAGSRVTGTLVRYGRDQGDVQRFVVTAAGRIVVESARLTWPDGTAVNDD